MQSKLKLLLIYFAICSHLEASNLYIASNNFLGEILKEIVGTKGRIISVNDLNDPKLYQPSPILLTQIGSSTAIFYSSDDLDIWIGNIKNIKKYSLVNMLGNFGIKNNPNDNVVSINPFFWLDPLTVKEILPKLVDTLSKLDPENANDFKVNSNLFSNRLDLLNTQINKYMQKNRGKKIITFGLGLEYFAKRNDLNILSNKIINASDNIALIDNLKSLLVPVTKKVVFGYKEMQTINDKNNSYSIGAFLYFIDLYGSKQKKRYSDLIIGNARVISKALE